jgi:hypothetical protein
MPMANVRRCSIPDKDLNNGSLTALVYKDAYTLDELVQLGPLGRTSLYRAIGEQGLRTKTFGRRRYVLRTDWIKFLRQEPPPDADDVPATGDIAGGDRGWRESPPPAAVDPMSRSNAPRGPPKPGTGIQQAQQSSFADGLKKKGKPERLKTYPE